MLIVSESCQESIIESPGLLNSSPNGDRPVTWMKLSPKSRSRVAKSGRPTVR